MGGFCGATRVLIFFLIVFWVLICIFPCNLVINAIGQLHKETVWLLTLQFVEEYLLEKKKSRVHGEHNKFNA